MIDPHCKPSRNGSDKLTRSTTEEISTWVFPLSQKTRKFHHHPRHIFSFLLHLFGYALHISFPCHHPFLRNYAHFSSCFPCHHHFLSSFIIVHSFLAIITSQYCTVSFLTPCHHCFSYSMVIHSFGSFETTWLQLCSLKMRKR